MARIYKRSDRITVKIDDITVKLSPLSMDEKLEIQMAMVQGKVKGDIKELTRGITLALKYSIKGIDGILDSDEKPYTLSFEGEYLSQDCVEELMNAELVKKLTIVCTTLVNGVPASFTDDKGNALEGVELVKPVKEDDSKKT